MARDDAPMDASPDKTKKDNEKIEKIKGWYEDDKKTNNILEGELNEREWFAENYALWRMRSIKRMSRKHGREIIELLNILRGK